MTPRRLAARLWHPRTTVRWRLTLLYGGLFLVSGAALLAITYTLVDHATVGTPARNVERFVSARAPDTHPLLGAIEVPKHVKSSFTRVPCLGQCSPPTALQRLLGTTAGRGVIVTVGSGQRITDLHQLVIESGIALAIMAVISAALGWLVAGRVLGPLRTMTATAQQISEANLHERLAMQGPRDELRRLADTIDGLLARLEGAFDAQRRFVANASHELRTPLTAARALLEMVISDPNATVGTFRETCGQVLEESEQQEQLIDALLALAQGQRGIDHREELDLAAITADVLRAHEPDAAERGLELDAQLERAPVAGDRRLLERLISNLLENAIRHNTADGSVTVHVAARSGRATMTVANTGPAVPADQIPRLLQPFQRLAPDRVADRDGVGLGLSIVAAIADAHGAELVVAPGASGGLEIDVRFPAVDAHGGQTVPRYSQPFSGLPSQSSHIGAH
jgi:signal transduction histidine kinase